MQKISILCTGRLKEPYWQEACREYEKRLGRFCRLETVELPEAPLPRDPSPAQVRRALSLEAQALTARLPGKCCLTALCLEGQPLSSEALARRLADSAAQGFGHSVFVIGSAYGLDASLKARAQLRLSLSAMTFPHRLARLMLLEQLYRCTQILSGGPYHK